MKAFLFFVFCLFFLSAAFQGTVGRENKTRNRSFFAFLNNLMSRRLSRTLVERDHSARGLMTDWLAAFKYRWGEIAYNATMMPFGTGPASAGHSSHGSFLNKVSVKYFRNISVFKFFSLVCFANHNFSLQLLESFGVRND